MAGQRPQAFVAVLLIELHLPENGDLKGKRKELQSVKSQLQRRHGVSVAEIDHHDLWQRATLLASLTGGSEARVDAAADGVERWLGWRFPDGVRVERTLASLEDLEG